jgi:hypothetical protein
MKIKVLSIIALIAILLFGIWYVFTYRTSMSTEPSTSEMVQPTQIAQEESPVVVAPTGGASTASEISLVITSPTNGSTVTSASITVSGKTSPNAEVFVNDEETTANASGNFSVNLTLDEGENPIVVSVNDAEGRVAQKELLVTYEIE